MKNSRVVAVLLLLAPPAFAAAPRIAVVIDDFGLTYPKDVPDAEWMKLKLPMTFADMPVAKPHLRCPIGRRPAAPGPVAGLGAASGRETAVKWEPASASPLASASQPACRTESRWESPPPQLVLPSPSGRTLGWVLRRAWGSDWGWLWPSAAHRPP